MSALAEDNHVMSTKKGFFNIEKNNGDIVPARIGLKDASTFPGFCNIHDTKMFLPAEGPDATLNEENAFLLSFRSVAYEYVMKQFAIVNYAVNRDNADKGAPFIKQVATQSLIDGVIKGTRMAIADINRWKIKYDAAYNKRDYSGFNAYMMAFDSVLPFIGAGAFMPEFDFEGNKLQHLGTTTGLEHLAVNVTVLGGVTVAVFGWWLDTSKVIDRFVESFAKLPEGQKASALTTCLFEHLENVYYRQSWWEGLTDSERVSLDELTRGGIYSRSPFSLSNRDLRVNAGVTKILDLRRN